MLLVVDISTLDLVAAGRVSVETELDPVKNV
jgi:hypothetical protein